jgi:hypothetical protein
MPPVNPARLTAACRNQLPVFHQRWLPPVTNPSIDDHGLGLGIRRRGLPRGPRGAAQLLLDRLSEVLQQVEVIGHLLGLRRALASAFRVETAAIPADDFNTWMLTQPPEARPRRVKSNRSTHMTSSQLKSVSTASLIAAVRWRCSTKTP